MTCHWEGRGAGSMHSCFEVLIRYISTMSPENLWNTMSVSVLGELKMLEINKWIHFAISFYPPTVPYALSFPILLINGMAHKYQRPYHEDVVSANSSISYINCLLSITCLLCITCTWLYDEHMWSVTYTWQHNVNIYSDFSCLVTFLALLVTYRSLCTQLIS